MISWILNPRPNNLFRTETLLKMDQVVVRLDLVVVTVGEGWWDLSEEAERLAQMAFVKQIVVDAHCLGFVLRMSDDRVDNSSILSAE